MFRFSKADVVCLALLFAVDLSVYAMLGNKHTLPLDPDSQAALEEEQAFSAMDGAADKSTFQPSTTNEVMEADDTQDPNYGLWEHTYGSYTVKTIHDPDQANFFVLQIFKAGELVYSDSSWLYNDPEKPEAEANNVPKPYSDLTGSGAPILVVADYTGGAHCCYFYHVFALGDDFGVIDNLNAEDGGLEFKDVDGDGIPEVQMVDWSYAYTFTSFAGSFAPNITLRFQNGEYQLATDLMFTEPPTDQDFNEMVQEIKTAYLTPPEGSDEVMPPNVWGSDAILWERMMDLIYAGHVDWALKLFEVCWQPQWEGKDEAEGHFWEQVARSDYGAQVVEAQGYVLPQLEPDPTEDTPENDAGQTFHIVDIGESLSMIAKKYEISVEALMAANDLDENTRIMVGQKLLIPSK